MARHIFISYVREDAQVVERLANELERHGLTVWLDRNKIAPGTRWREAIRDAIRSGDLFFACFSRASGARERLYMNEELTLAIAELRQRPSDRTWFIPILLEGGEVPQRSISADETLRDLQWVDLSRNWETGVAALVLVGSNKPERRSPARETSQPYVPSIFLSYAARATSIATALRRRLSAHFVVSESQISPGSNVRDEVQRRISLADYFLAIWTADPNRPGEISPWLPYELGIAAALKKPTLLVVSRGIRDIVWRRVQYGVLLSPFDDVAREGRLAEIVEYCKIHWLPPS